ncbi:MAG: ATP-binding protein, partial [Dokdonella sp.]
MATPVLLAWSGGKDCLMTLDRLLADPQWKVEALLTTLDRARERVAMHDVRADVLRAQATALGLPLIEMPIDWP